MQFDKAIKDAKDMGCDILRFKLQSEDENSAIRDYIEAIGEEYYHLTYATRSTQIENTKQFNGRRLPQTNRTKGNIQ